MFDFLGLPREIRDEIYTLCLVRENIEFEEFYTDETPEDWMQDRKPEALTLHIAKPDETPLLVYQGVSFVHRVESLTPIDGRSRWDDIFYKGRERSYRIHRGITNPPCLNILLTNRLIYQESSMIFYAKNYFCFPSRECELTLNACSGFLTNRSKQALTYISNISLGIGHIDRLHRLSETGYRRYQRYMVHWPTMERLGNIFRETLSLMGLKKLKITLQDQRPSDRALASRLQTEEYSALLDWALAARATNSIKDFKDLQIELVESYRDSSTDGTTANLRLLAEFLTGSWSVYTSNVSSSTVNVGGKEVSHARMTWPPSQTG
ncbi:MAG: hypothetical protein Q9195_002967 [Heterodermia aff. obscurata]